MTKEEWANILNGREYGNEVTQDEQFQMEAEGFVVAITYSDDSLVMLGRLTMNFMIARM
jgi:hypothetical protein